VSLEKKVLRCPTCRTLVTIGDENFPFCSDRCRLIDLGKWASGAYRISSPILDPEVLEDIDNQAVERARRTKQGDED
jgi:hypothetical protein